MKALCVLLVLSLARLALPSSGCAGLIVSVGDLTLPAGGTGFVDVHIRSDGADLLNQFTFALEIAPVGVTGTQLQFRDPQPDSQLNHPDYVFSGNSLKQLTALPIGTVGLGLDTFEGFDLTADLSDIPLAGIDKLLIRLDVTAATGAPPVAGDQFTISLVDSLFLNSQGLADLNIDASTLSGTVTISEASAVPEPASMMLFWLGGLAVTGAARRHRRRRAGEAASF